MTETGTIPSGALENAIKCIQAAEMYKHDLHPWAIAHKLGLSSLEQAERAVRLGNEISWFGREAEVAHLGSAGA